MKGSIGKGSPPRLTFVKLAPSKLAPSSSDVIVDGTGTILTPYLLGKIAPLISASLKFARSSLVSIIIASIRLTLLKFDQDNLVR